MYFTQLKKPAEAITKLCVFSDFLCLSELPGFFRLSAFFFQPNFQISLNLDSIWDFSDFIHVEFVILSVAALHLVDQFCDEIHFRWRTTIFKFKIVKNLCCTEYACKRTCWQNGLLLFRNVCHIARYWQLECLFDICVEWMHSIHYDREHWRKTVQYFHSIHGHKAFPNINSHTQRFRQYGLSAKFA